MQDASPLSQLVMVKLLQSIVGGITVCTVYPRDAPPELVVVQRVGGTYATPITDGATFSVQCYAPTQFAAEQLAAMVSHALFRGAWTGMRINGHMVRGWRPAGAPQLLIDPDRPEVARFQFAGQLLVSTLRAP